ncbi:hypothetical protein PIB30_041234 [Stylosanthes scabra]|uniref:Uncharacterized protein n=1 Tax=Stylosanthes scabra TaxID=79078 RepID=A0ABU6TF45_9FABA|nr:hypothetical protein [Stylosanthes scabra]
MVQEIKEGQQAYTSTLKQNSNNSYVKPTRHCGIGSCDSHHTDECPQLQDDNIVAATQDFFEPTANPPYNRQYRNQGWRDNQLTRGNPPPQQQGQQRQPYTYSQPQNNQNKENQEIKKIQRRIAEQISKLYEMMQDTTSPPAQRSYNLWYDLIAQLADSDDEESEVESEGVYSDESGEDEVGRKEEDEEDSKKILVKSLKTKRKMKIGSLQVPGTWTLKKAEEIFTNADAGVVSVVGIAEDVKVRIGRLIIPIDFHVIKPGKKDNGGTPQVLLGRPFLKSGGFKLNYHEEIFTFEVGNIIEIFHFDDSPEPEKKGLHQLKIDKKRKKKKRIAKKRRARKRKLIRKTGSSRFSHPRVKRIRRRKRCQLWKRGKEQEK